MWQSYLCNRLIKKNSGFSTIIPDNAEPAVSLSCSVCNNLLRIKEDEISYFEFGCCNLCALKWAHARKLKWQEGWRPTKEQVDAAVKERPALLVSFDVT